MQTNSEIASLLDCIKNFFPESEGEKQQLCTNCGSSMRFLDAQFQLFGTEMKWDVSLPFCPICDLVSRDLVSRTSVM
jgi:hypothetical protein